ncbi:beta-lactamase domain-containing protein [Psychromonas sp. CNPT3]|uniref:MBL fold metallo-hydrolase n=1 Tax=Psychromonas sp. CNPT3 TaxID=314282 RepID=UPI00006E8918|nr:MBL fold metallo-hydrolase [Psychromonas sp. CNPT3]AGH82418.1 beta-lactamase domain-containing protein [Psychromonas sp. CNPT3]
MKIIVIPVTPFEQNCSLIICEQTNKAAIVDPGGDVQRILDVVKQQNVIIDKVILTHGHLDHVGGAQRIANKLKVSIIGPEKEDLFWLESLEEQSQHFGFPMHTSFLPEKWLEEGEIVNVGNIKLQVLHIPGHTPGHIALLDEQSQQVIVGDILFCGAVGRSDFPRGDHNQLIRGIKSKLLTLPGATLVYPGHGPITSIAKEKRSNPYLR